MIKRNLFAVTMLLVTAPALAQAPDPHAGHAMPGAAPAAPMDHSMMPGMDHSKMDMTGQPSPGDDPMAGMDHSKMGHGGMAMTPAPKGITRAGIGPAEAALQAFSDALEVGNRDLAIARLAPEVRIVGDGIVENLADYVGGHLAADIAYQKTVKTILLARDVVPENASHVRIVSKLRMISNRSDKAIDTSIVEEAHLARFGTGWKIVRLEWRKAA